MLKNKNAIFFTALGLGFLMTMCILTLTAGRDAAAISDGVLRFHIVANSDSSEDQALKLKVRDGIATLTDQLFAQAENKEAALQIAKQNVALLQTTATDILRKNDCTDAVQVEIKNLFFPTKTYENITFPAGEYDAIHITIGKGEGQNFWCVMFPALCVPSATKENTKLLEGVLDRQQLGLVTRPYTFKFKLAEWFGNLKMILKK